MSETQVFVFCLMMAEYFSLGVIAGIAFREDIRNYMRRKRNDRT